MVCSAWQSLCIRVRDQKTGDNSYDINVCVVHEWWLTWYWATICCALANNPSALSKSVPCRYSTGKTPWGTGNIHSVEPIFNHHLAEKGQVHCSDTELVTADSKAKRTPHFITPGRKRTNALQWYWTSYNRFQSKKDSTFHNTWQKRNGFCNDKLWPNCKRLYSRKKTRIATIMNELVTTDSMGKHMHQLPWKWILAANKRLHDKKDTYCNDNEF